MIYQTNQTFNIFPFEAEWEYESQPEHQYVIDKPEFESELKQRIAELEEIPVEDVILPAITYTDIVLTPEQQTRFTTITELPSVTLDEVRDYTTNGTKPETAPFKIMELQEVIADLTELILFGGE